MNVGMLKPDLGKIIYLVAGMYLVPKILTRVKG
jgi:hypothetical protein